MTSALHNHRLQFVLIEIIDYLRHYIFLKIEPNIGNIPDCFVFFGIENNGWCAVVEQAIIGRNAQRTIDHHTHWIMAAPLTRCQVRIVEQCSVCAYQNGRFHRANLMIERLCNLVRNAQRRRASIFANFIDKAVGSLRPFQQNEGTFFCVKSDETAIQPATFLLKHLLPYLHASLAQHGNATSVHFFVWVAHANHHARDSLFDDKLGARRRFAIVRTGFEAHIERRLRQEFGIFHRSNGIHLGMRQPAAMVVAFTNNSAIMNQHRAHHGIWSGLSFGLLRQLQATTHIKFVSFHQFLLEKSTYKDTILIAFVVRLFLRRKNHTLYIAFSTKNCELCSFVF